MPPNIQRGFIVNAAELGTYDHSKEWLITSGIFREGVFAHTGASFIAGFAGAAASNPYVALLFIILLDAPNAFALTPLVYCALYLPPPNPTGST